LLSQGIFAVATNGPFTLVKFGEIMPTISRVISLLALATLGGVTKIEMILSLLSVAVAGVIAFKHHQSKGSLTILARQTRQVLRAIHQSIF
jgi:hypothetical protein